MKLLPALLLCASAFAQPLIVGPNSHVVVMEYEAWFGPNAVTFEGSAIKPVLTSDSMRAKGLSGYDSTDPAVIAQHSTWLQQMGVDAILLDLTNGANCTWFTSWQRYCNASDRAGFSAIKASTLNMYPALTGLHSTLKVIPLIGAGELQDYDLDSDGKNAVEKQLDTFASLISQYPNLSFIFDGEPLVVAFTGAPQSLDQNAPWRKVLALAAKYPNLTIRVMAGFLDDQPALWSRPVGIGGLREVNPLNPIWSWVDRLNPTFGLYPSYVPRNGGAANLTASLATPSRQEGWMHGAVYSPEDALRAGGATFRAFMAKARELAPTFLVIHQFNEFGENGPDAETNSDIEPSSAWGMSGVNLVRDEIAAYRAAVAPQPPPQPVIITPPVASTATADIPMVMLVNGQPVTMAYRPSNGTWYSGSQVIQFGLPGDMPLIIQWQGSQHIAVFRPSTRQTIVNVDNLSFHGNQLIL